MERVFWFGRTPRFPCFWVSNPFSKINSTAAIEVTRVADLIDSTTGQWNKSLLWNVFPPEQAEAITKIHLSMESHYDQHIWTMEKSSRFTVKSMYREVVR